MKPWLKILIGLVLGAITGLILNRQVEILALVGKAFVDLLAVRWMKKRYIHYEVEEER